VLASKAQIFCGEYSISWSTLETVITLILRMPQARNVQDSRLKGESGFIEKIIFVCSYHYGVDRQSRILHLFSLLANLRQHQATDPRDKVFALLGVATMFKALS
jgi:hypothetical protein